MARKRKEEDLYIQRASQATIDAAIKDGVKKVYYYLEDDKYIVWDLRGKTPVMMKFDTIDELVRKVN